MHAVVTSPADRPKRGVSEDNLRAIWPPCSRGSADAPSVQSADHPRREVGWAHLARSVLDPSSPGEVP
jgi:hypothetical protein